MSAYALMPSSQAIQSKDNVKARDMAHVQRGTLKFPSLERLGNILTDGGGVISL